MKNWSDFLKSSKAQMEKITAPTTMEREMKRSGKIFWKALSERIFSTLDWFLLWNFWNLPSHQGLFCLQIRPLSFSSMKIFGTLQLTIYVFFYLWMEFHGVYSINFSMNIKDNILRRHTLCFGNTHSESKLSRVPDFTRDVSQKAY